MLFSPCQPNLMLGIMRGKCIKAGGEKGKKKKYMKPDRNKQVCVNRHVCLLFYFLGENSIFVLCQTDVVHWGCTSCVKGVP